jgi:hypothetical protein
MTLAYQDFWPGTLPMRRSPGGLAWEPMAVMLERVNAWRATCPGRVINVETLLLPVARKKAVNAGAGGMQVRWDDDHTWVQVVRVWYEVEGSPPVLPETGTGPGLAGGPPGG